MKIDPADPEIIGFQEIIKIKSKKKEIKASKTYSPRGRHAARAKEMERTEMEHE